MSRPPRHGKILTFPVHPDAPGGYCGGMLSEWSRLRHDLRSGFNNVRLCLAALETETDPAEQVQWLQYIENAADKCLQTLEEIERMPEPEAGQTSVGARHNS